MNSWRTGTTASSPSGMPSSWAQWWTSSANTDGVQTWKWIE